MLLFEVLRDVGRRQTRWYSAMSHRDYRFLIGFKISTRMFVPENLHEGKVMVQFLIDHTDHLCVAPMFVYTATQEIGNTIIQNNDTDFDILFEDLDDAMLFKLKYHEDITQMGVWVRDGVESVFREANTIEEIQHYDVMRKELT